jgi:hypothetical protein
MGRSLLFFSREDQSVSRRSAEAEEGENGENDDDETHEVDDRVHFPAFLTRGDATQIDERDFGCGGYLKIRQQAGVATFRHESDPLVVGVLTLPSGAEMEKRPASAECWPADRNGCWRRWSTRRRRTAGLFLAARNGGLSDRTLERLDAGFKRAGSPPPP